MSNKFEVRCAYCPPSADPLMVVSAPVNGNVALWKKAWKETATSGEDGGPQYSEITCPNCKSTYAIVDDGIDSNDGGFITTDNRSSPSVESLSISGGIAKGGSLITVNGRALDHGDLTVKFGGKPVQWMGERTPTSVKVKSPKGQYTLNVVDGPYYTLSIVSVTGAFIVDEPVTFSAGGSGIIKKIDTSSYMIKLALSDELAQELVGKTMSGTMTAATGKVVNVAFVDFIPGEAVVGAVSNAGGVVKTSKPLVIDMPTSSFAPNETVVGQSSGAMAKLSGSPAYSGKVDVTVENEYGQRVDGSSVLIDGFIYS